MLWYHKALLLVFQYNIVSSLLSLVFFYLSRSMLIFYML